MPIKDPYKMRHCIHDQVMDVKDFHDQKKLWGNTFPPEFERFVFCWKSLLESRFIPLLHSLHKIENEDLRRDVGHEMQRMVWNLYLAVHEIEPTKKPAKKRAIKVPAKPVRKLNKALKAKEKK